MESKTNNLNAIITYLCKKNGIQKKDLAEKLGINPVSLSRTLAKGNPKPETIKAYAEALGMIYEELNWYLNNASKIRTEEWGELYEQAKASGWQLDHGELIRDYIEAYTKQLSGVSDSDEISAVIVFRENTLYASSLKETKDIIQSIEAIKEMEKQGTDTAAKAIQDLLITKYEKK